MPLHGLSRHTAPNPCGVGIAGSHAALLALLLASVVACPAQRATDPDAGPPWSSADTGAGDSTVADHTAPDSAALPDRAGHDVTRPDAARPDAAAADATCLDCQGPEDNAVACTDGHDNDGDGYTDCVDFNCNGIPPCADDEVGVALCTDGIDNDGDGYADCIDFGCRDLSLCNPNEDHARTCTDLFDNDGDGATDCADDSCAPLPVCDPDEHDEATCSDGVDNDGDGQRDCLDSACAATTVCSRATVRIASWNIAGLGAAGSAEHQAAEAVIARIDADVFCLQEVEDADGAALASLAATLGYPHRFQAEVSTPMAGGLRNACLSRLPLAGTASLSSPDISSDAAANETGRDFAQVRVEVRPGVAFVGLLVAHLKSGFEAADLFRKQIEAQRLGQAANAYALAHPGEGLVVTGDLNEEIDGWRLGQIFEALPDGLPYSYQLGADISWPTSLSPTREPSASPLPGVRARPG